MLSRPDSTASEGRAMLELARRAVTEAVVHNRLPENILREGIFAERRGVFVTLHVRQSLRGCIGVIEGDNSLGENIVRSAVSAAKQDPRFSPVRPEELSELEIEISVLSPLFLIRAEDVRIGTHGLLIIRGPRRGLLLPQVAVEHGLSQEQFLEETCRKAGLPHGAWREPEAKLLGFTCEIHSEFAAQGSDTAV
jgi:AmmeMemoRadiSam system protein A